MSNRLKSLTRSVALLLGGGSGSGLKDSSQLYIAYMQSATFEDSLVEKFKLQEKVHTKY